ncbi:hypothetical protein [Micromonospora sp. HM134]|uniref:hypothetical protein n=1 Tax=unclassified Micromonospora TaxID=2617518 RepID=UPI0018902099
MTEMVAFGQPPARLVRALFSALSTVSRQRAALYDGSQVAGSWSLLAWLTLSVTAASGRLPPRSLAYAWRRLVLQLRAPESHASASGTSLRERWRNSPVSGGSAADPACPG